VTRAPLGDGDSARRLNETIQSWSEQWSGSLLGIEHQPVPDDRGHFHWLIRLKGDEKDVITLWFSLRQRSVHVETELMPAPEENREALLRFLLVRNAELREVHFAIGPEEGIYLMTQIPMNEIDVDRLDELVGATVTYVDEIYPTAMTMGLPTLYRRRLRK
jgi:hypothetical protein